MESSKYADFSYGKLNRRISEVNLKRLKKSIEKHGQLAPITVCKLDGKLFIIDGQHRFLACRDLKKSVQYLLVKIKKEQLIGVMSEMNGQVLKWKKLDFVEAYAKDGIPVYMEIKDFLETDSYGDFGITAMVNLFRVISDTKKITRRCLENGDFEITDWDTIYKFADYLMEMKPYTDYYKHFQFVEAMTVIWRDPNFDRAWFIKQLSKGKHKESYAGFERDRFNGVANASRYRQIIASVYNHYLPASKVRLV